MDGRAGGLSELLPSWLFAARTVPMRVLVTGAITAACVASLWLPDDPDQMRLSPLLMLGIVAVASTCGSIAAAVAAAVAIPSYWRQGIPDSGSFDIGGVDDVVALAAFVALAVGVIVLTRTIERSLAEVAELDEQRQLAVLDEAASRTAAQQRMAEATAVVELAAELATATTRTAVAAATLARLTYPTEPTTASVAIVEDGHLRMLATHNADQRSITLIERVPVAESRWLRAVFDGAPIFVDNRDAFAAENPDAGVLQLYPAGSWAVIPFRAEGTVGLLSVHYMEPQRLSAHTQYFQLVAEILATNLQRAYSDELRAAQLDEVRGTLAERDRIARTLSTTLVPPRLPRLDGYTAAGWLVPASPDEVAGDFYDLFTPGDGSWVAVLGDVCGKGAEAAAVTSLARYAARVTALGGADPVEVVAMADTALRMDSSDLLCTMAIVRCDTAGGRLEVSLAGHPQVRIVGPDGVRRVGRFGTLLGLEERARCGVVDVLQPGEAAVLFSDGLIERSREFGEDELDDVLARYATLDAGTLAAALSDEIKNLPADRTDDQALLIVRRDPQ